MKSVRPEYLFPTVIYTTVIEDADRLNSDLLNLIREDRQRNHVGFHQSNIEGWHSAFDIHRDSRYEALTSQINELGDAVGDHLGYCRNHMLAIDSMWSIINGPGAHNSCHVHPESLWSGVYYVQTPEDGGDICFLDLRTAHVMHSPHYAPQKERKAETWTRRNYTPQAGMMFLFPIWLYHEVTVNKSRDTGDDAERVVIAFNMTQYIRS